MTGTLKFCSSNCIEGVNQLFSWVGNLAGYFGADSVESNANTAAGEAIDGDASTCTTLASGAAANIDLKVFDEQGITNLPRHQDQKQAIARDMAVLGLPVTVILNPEGEEIARLMGEADWYSDSARAIINALKSGS